MFSTSHDVSASIGPTLLRSVVPAQIEFLLPNYVHYLPFMLSSLCLEKRMVSNFLGDNLLKLPYLHTILMNSKNLQLLLDYTEYELIGM
jgi:hypothetical protein